MTAVHAAVDMQGHVLLATLATMSLQATACRQQKVGAKALSVLLLLLLLLLLLPASLLLIGKPTAAVPSTHATCILQYHLLDFARPLSACMQY